MAYVKTAWVDDVTPLSAANLNRIEQGVEDANCLVPGDTLQHGVLTGGTVTFLTSSSLRVAAGSAWILQASGLLQRVTWQQTDITGIPAASVAQRVDQLVVDSNGVVSRLPGTDGAATDLTARAGAAGVPVGSLRLADFIVFTSGVQTATDATRFRDRRPWARGARTRQWMSSDGGYTSISTALTEITPLRKRVEVSTGRLLLRGRCTVTQSADLGVLMVPMVDGAEVTVANGGGRTYQGYTAIVSTRYYWTEAAWELDVAVGSHLVSWGLANGSGTGTLALYVAAAGPNPQMYAEERLVPWSDNGTA